jgi:spore coat polysaccharide biosynthesis predicted glycosyltransferase SpsG
LSRILFFTSNGTGLGHLTRSMAIARRLDGRLEPLVFTMSAAAPVVREQGFPVEFSASYRTPCAGTEWRWSRRLRGRARAAITEADPALVVFDGAHPYLGFLDALRAERGVRSVWCRRAMWKPGANVAALPRAAAFDAVLEPGEVAAAADRGPTVERRDEAKCVAPMVYLDREAMLPRAEAERELGLEPGRTNVLVALGQGPEVADATARSLSHLATRRDVQVATLRSPVASAVGRAERKPSTDARSEARSMADAAGLVELDATYPMSRYYAAFDLVVSAAGYNAYHELLALRVPALFVPMTRETDDQAARARHAATAGLGRAVDGPASGRLEAELDALLDADVRDGIATNLAALEMPDGAREAADWLVELAGGERAPAGGEREKQRNWHLPGGSPRETLEFLARVPRGVAALGKQLIVSPRPPRTVVLALGLSGPELEREVAATLARAQDPPERVLVITDSLDFAPLRRAGVGFEYVPARGERQPDLAGGDYDSFLRSRLELILAERPRPRRAIAIGAADEAALQAAI